jgi:hypothetical protein
MVSFYLDPQVIALAFGALLVLQGIVGFALPRLSPQYKTLTPTNQVLLTISFVSCLHATFSTVSAAWLIGHIESPSTFEKQFIPGTAVTTVGSVFFAYLLHDLIHNLGFLGKHFGKKRSEQVFHHLLFIAMVLMHSSSNEMNFSFPFVYVGELSTVFLDLRFMGKHFGCPSLESACTKLFALTFFLTRVVLFGWFCFQIFMNWEGISANVESPVIRSSLSILFPIALTLQVYWMYLILAVLRKPPRADTKSS